MTIFQIGNMPPRGCGCREYNPRLALAERDVLITIVGYAMIKAEIKFYE